MEGQFQSLNRTSAGKRNKASGIVRWPVQEKVTHVASLRFHRLFLTLQGRIQFLTADTKVAIA